MPLVTSVLLFQKGSRDMLYNSALIARLCVYDPSRKSLELEPSFRFLFARGVR